MYDDGYTSLLGRSFAFTKSLAFSGQVGKSTPAARLLGRTKTRATCTCGPILSDRLKLKTKAWYKNEIIYTYINLLPQGHHTTLS